MVKSTFGSLAYVVLYACLFFELTNVYIFKQEPQNASARTPPAHRLIAQMTSSHNVSDVNAIVWCPRTGYEDLLATAGDDTTARVWKVVKT